MKAREVRKSEETEGNGAKTRGEIARVHRLAAGGDYHIGVVKIRRNRARRRPLLLRPTPAAPPAQAPPAGGGGICVNFLRRHCRLGFLGRSLCCCALLPGPLLCGGRRGAAREAELTPRISSSTRCISDGENSPLLPRLAAAGSGSGSGSGSGGISREITPPFGSTSSSRRLGSGSGSGSGCSRGCGCGCWASSARWPPPGVLRLASLGFSGPRGHAAAAFGAGTVRARQCCECCMQNAGACSRARGRPGTGGAARGERAGRTSVAPAARSSRFAPLAAAARRCRLSNFRLCFFLSFINI